jgi:UDP-N-acetylglucosamine diphosphorylase/glucosamine-1-phosphate N-acetyltransferase
MNLILFDDKEWFSLLPLTYTRAVSDIRIGILSFSERWKNLLSTPPSIKTQDYLQKKYNFLTTEKNIFINPAFFPTYELVEKILVLQDKQAIFYENNLVAYCGETLDKSALSAKIKLTDKLIHLVYPWDIFSHNAYALRFDFELLTQNRVSQTISSTNGLTCPENIFLEKGAKIEYAILNATDGPIYVGENAEIMEGSMIRGGFSLGNDSKINMGAKIYGATTIGPHCKIGGEVNNSIFFGYSNKAHDGFIGNSVIGEWCNLGANTNNSNLKNNYSQVKMWSIQENKYTSTGLQFCGMVMADHSKTAIDSKINTGTMIGVSSSIFTSGFPEKFIPSFSWLGENPEKYELKKAIQVAKIVMKRRGIEMSKYDQEIFTFLFENSN